MGNCSLCGQDKKLFYAIVEDSKLKVCKECGSSHGEIKSAVNNESKSGSSSKKNRSSSGENEEVSEEFIVSDYPEIIKNAREKKDLSQDEFAKGIKEKVSLVSKIESGSFEPSIELAEKLESFLGVSLIEEVEVSSDSSGSGSSDELTIGDIIELK